MQQVSIEFHNVCTISNSLQNLLPTNFSNLDLLLYKKKADQKHQRESLCSDAQLKSPQRTATNLGFDIKLLLQNKKGRFSSLKVRLKVSSTQHHGKTS